MMIVQTLLPCRPTSQGCPPCNPPHTFISFMAITPGWPLCQLHSPHLCMHVLLCRDGVKVPADNEPGLLHCYDFYSYAWTTLRTAGRSTLHSW